MEQVIDKAVRAFRRAVIITLIGLFLLGFGVGFLIGYLI